HLLDEKNVKMLTAHIVFTETELKSRCEIMLDNYCKTVVIEANAMADMARREILPAIEGYVGELAETAKNKAKAFAGVSVEYEKTTAEKLSALCFEIMEKTEELEKELIALKSSENVIAEGYGIRDKLLPKMNELRAAADMAETLTSSKYWPFPTYGDLLFGVK
ncbi:MAG: glutamine synthetase type III, partial [Clostridia bacterium]|nr:glutamine synthetase type III [Clostridia bacterium]